MKNFTRLMLICSLSAVFFIGQLTAQNILCVDRAFGDSSGVYTDDWPFFQASLDANGYTYEHFKVEEAANNGPDATYMSDFDIIIWFTGEAWQGNETMTLDDEFNLLLYLTLNNGKLFLSAQDYLYDRYGAYGTFVPGEFPYDQLGVVEVVQDVWHIEVGDPQSIGDSARFIGAPGSIAEGLSFPVEDIYSGDEDDGLYADSLAQHLGQSLFSIAVPYVSDGTAGLQYETAAFRVLFTTLSFAAITDIEARDEFLYRIVDWLMYGSSGTNELIKPAESILIHPNPATDFVNIGMINPMKEVRIINSQGQVVYQQDVNSIKTKIDISTLPTGVYIVQAINDGGYATGRMVIQ